MSLSLFLAAALVPPPPSAAAPETPAVADEIRVIALKMKAWKGGVSKKDGKLVCVTKKSSGDREVDAIRCNASLLCVTPIAAEMDALAAETGIAVAERKRRLTALAQSTQPCMVRYYEQASQALAERRAGA